MSNEKLKTLTKYAEGLENRLSSPVPEKHVGHPETFRQFLQRDLDATRKKIEALKLTGQGSGK